MEFIFDNDRPIYVQLVETLRTAIVSGEYPPGARLPSVRELAIKAQVNPNTMQRALQQVEDEGLIYTEGFSYEKNYRSFRNGSLCC